MNREFVQRLKIIFNGETMADVARRLKIPHATVRNYYRGRLPAPEVLVKIANETGVSLNWLLIGSGNKYAGTNGSIDLGRFIEERIGSIVEQKLAETNASRLAGELSDVFDVEEAVLRLDDPQAVMSEWFRHDNRKFPSDYGIVFFGGWETFSPREKVEAVIDAKKVLDRSLKSS